MWLLSSVILFMGCPTPPDKAQTNNAPQNAQTHLHKAVQMGIIQVLKETCPHKALQMVVQTPVTTPQMAMVKVLWREQARRRW